MVCLIENQQYYYEQLGRLGYASQIGIRNSDGSWEIKIEAIKELLGCQEKRDFLTQSVIGLIDLKGAERVTDFLVEFQAN